MRIVLLPILAALLVACSPEQNWRQITFDGTALKAQLPCKPDRTTREVPLGGVPVQLSVAGCESGAAMLAIMTARLATGADVQAILAGWQQATLAHLHVQAPPQFQPWQPTGLLPIEASRHVQLQGRRSDGRPITAQAVWGAFAEGSHVRVVHAVVYADTIAPDTVQTFFEGIRP